MSDFKILDDLAARPGQSQAGRIPQALLDHFVDVDERSSADLYRLMQQLAKKIRFFEPGSGSGPTKQEKNWENFFRSNWEELLAMSEGARVPPHLALVATFLKLYEEPRRLLNGLTAAHLDFQYRQVLRLAERPPEPGHAHLLVQLKKNVGPTVVDTSARFLVKPPMGPDLLYAPVRPAAISPCEVKSLCAVHVEPGTRGGVRFAPVSNSADGLGRPLPPDKPCWSAFGSFGAESDRWPRARVGFALSSPILRLRGGARTVTVKLRLDPRSVGGMQDRLLEKLFDVSITGEGGWIDLQPVSAELAGDILSFTVEISAKEKPIVDYQEKAHGGRFQVKAPVMQFLLGARYNGSQPTRQDVLGYTDIAAWTVRSAQIYVLVSGLSGPDALWVENDAGPLDPASAFLPFGPLPTRGARWYLGCDEALSKRLTRLDLTLRWKGVPADLAAHYKDYEMSITGNDAFTAAFDLDGALVRTVGPRNIPLFEAEDAQAPRRLELGASLAPVASQFSDRQRYRALIETGTRWAAELASELAVRQPTVLAPDEPAPARSGARVVFTLENEDGLLHATYRRRQIEAVLKYTKAPSGEPRLLREPYTPQIGSLSLSYSAESEETPFDDSQSLEGYLAAEVRFFHVGCFGQMRQHAIQRKQLGLAAETEQDPAGPSGISILPLYQGAEFFVGVSGLEPGGEIGLLFQVAEGTAGPDKPAEPPLWSVLCDNYWRPLIDSDVIADTTRHLRQSGILRFRIPTEATVGNSILAPGNIWLRAQADPAPLGMAKLVAVAANAVEVQLTHLDPGHADPSRLTVVIPGKSPVTIQVGPPGVQSVQQPFSSFGERPVEPAQVFRTRSAERLRHKGRCVTAWDYERLVLEAFPEIHTVRCIPHSRADQWLTPGHVVLIVIPDPRRLPYADPLRPVASGDLLRRIREFVAARAGSHVNLEVRNPRRQIIDLEFQVRFLAGPRFAAGSASYRRQLTEELNRLLSIGASDSGLGWEIARGGRIYKSSLLDFIYKCPFVEEVRHLRMFATFDGVRREVSEAVAEAPDVIFAAGNHVIEALPDRPTA